jgi:phage shock protein PspC (stress-responsive transcriptional regulator)
LIFVGLALLTAILPMVLFYLIAWLVIPSEQKG